MRQNKNRRRRRRKMRSVSRVVGGVGRGYVKERRRKGRAQSGSSTQDKALKTPVCVCKMIALEKIQNRTHTGRCAFSRDTRSHANSWHANAETHINRN